MNLVRAELSRLVARRFVQLMTVLLVAAFGITVATTMAVSHRPSADELVVAAQEARDNRAAAERYHQDCLAAQRSGTPEEVRESFPRSCTPPDPADYRAENYLAGVFVFAREIQPLTYFLAAFLALFGFLIGASFVGAELASGGMTNLLLWKPRRTVVLATKLGTLLAAVSVLSVVATVLYVGAFRVAAEMAGLPGAVDGELWAALAATAGRALVMTLVATALGFGIATLGRHTAAALGVVAAYVVVWELGARVVMEIVEFGRPERWMFSTYVGAWMVGEVQLWDRAGGGCASDIVPCDWSYTISWVDATVVFLVLLGALLGSAFATFARRDLA